MDQFIAPSEFVKQKLIEYGFAGARIRVIPHFQRLPQVPTAAPSEDAPILYFGRLSAEKGVADLIRAMRHVRGVKLTIAGDGPQKEELESLVRNLALDTFNISYGASFGPYAKRYFRIGHLGDINDGWLIGVLGMTEMALELAGIPHKKGGVQAAMDYIVSAHSGGARAAAE